jgi:Ser-tRNA(Ala) deacylase AlaX
MLKKIKHLKGEQLYLLISMSNTDIEAILAGKEIDENKLKYKELLYDTSHPENHNVDFSVEKIFDQLMFDNYDIYLKMKERDSQVDNFDEDFIEDNMKEIFEESNRIVKKFIKLYEKLLLDSKFEYANIRQVQKSLIEKEIIDQAKVENYEYCIELKKKLQEV